MRVCVYYYVCIYVSECVCVCVSVCMYVCIHYVYLREIEYICVWVCNVCVC